jgi:hypothetical protein
VNRWLWGAHSEPPGKKPSGDAMKTKVLLITVHGGTGSKNVSGVYSVRGNVEKGVGRLIDQVGPVLATHDETVVGWVVVG